MNQKPNPRTLINGEIEAAIGIEQLKKLKKLALTKNHQNLETEHLLYSLLKKNEIAIKVIERSGGSIKRLLIEVDEFIKNQPKMQKTQESIFFGKNISLSISRAKNSFNF